LNLRAREGYEAVSLEEVKDALPEEISDDADVISEVERVSQMYTLVAVVFVVQSQGG
jgi:hypothetical protein